MNVEVFLGGFLALGDGAADFRSKDFRAAAGKASQTGRHQFLENGPHGPPRGHGDRLTDGGRAGCEFLAARIEATAPRLCVYGHIHEDPGVWEVGATTLANVSYVDEHYVVRPGGARVFDLAGGGAARALAP